MILSCDPGTMKNGIGDPENPPMVGSSEFLLVVQKFATFFDKT